MNLNGAPAFSIKSIVYEIRSEFTMPNGTVTVAIDRRRGLMEIFAEHEADPLDWELTCGLIDRMGLSGRMPAAEYLKGVDVWIIQLKPGAQTAC